MTRISDQPDVPGDSTGPLAFDAPPPVIPRQLSAEDADAIETILARRLAGVKTGPVAAGAGPRVEAAARALGMLEAYPVEEPPADLVAQTMDQVAAARQRERFQQQVEMLTRPAPTLGLGWGQVAAAAAIFLIAAALIMPVLERNRADSMRAMAAGNLQNASMALLSYGAANRGVMPSQPTRAGDPWLNVGAPVQAGGFVQSNSANLFQLIRGGFVSDPEVLNDPANPFAPTHGEVNRNQHDWSRPEQVSFSYQNQFRPGPLLINEHPNLVVLATKNPMFVIRDGKLQYDPTVACTAASRMHDGRGQHLLFANGAVRWTTRPVVTYRSGREDAIYAADGQTTYTGRELPAHADDSFLVP